MKKSLPLLRLSLLAVTLLCIFSVAQAQDFWYKGVHYRMLEDNTAEVTYMDHYNYDYNKYKSYKGDIEIPATVIATIRPMYEKPYEVSVTVSKIGENAFNSCKELRSVIIPATVNTIDEEAFRDCEKLDRVIFRGSIEYIEQSAFNSCTSLQNINLPEGLKRIGTFAFSNSGLTKVTFPSSLRGFGYQAFSNCKDLAEVNNIPEGVTSLSGTFAFCTSLKHIHLPNTVSLLEETFRGCSSLEEIVIPNSVTEISIDTFRGCSSLTDIVVPNSVSMIRSAAFSECPNLATIVLGENCQFEGIRCFYNSTNLYSITSLNMTPYSYDPENVFENFHYNNATLYVPFGYRQNYKRTDFWNKFVKIFELPYSVEVDGIYYKYLGDGELSICHGPMDNHYTGHFVIPKTVDINGKTCAVVDIDADAFRGVDLGPNDDLLSVGIPDEVLFIGACAFKNCRNLTEITSLGVEVIKFLAFSGCESLEWVHFGYDLDEIAFLAFEDCPKLRYISIDALKPPRIASSTFMPEHYRNATVRVRTGGAEKAYKKDSSWKKFNDISTRSSFGAEVAE